MTYLTGNKTEYLTHLTTYGITPVWKWKIEWHDGFIPLIRTAKCENVPISELKIAASKASEVIISKLDLDDDRLTEVLSEGGLSLMKEHQGNNGSFK